MIEQNDVGGELANLVALRIEVALSGIDQEAEHQTGDGGDEGGTQPDDVLGVGVQMVLRQHAAQHHAR
jgi:hypothetical protein